MSLVAIIVKCIPHRKKKMDRKIYKGRFQPYLENVIINHLRQLKREPLDTVDVVVATNLLRRHLKARLVEQEGTIAGVKFWSFKDIEEESYKHMGNVNKTLSKEESILLILRALDDVPSEDVFYAFKEKVGFAKAVLETIADLKDADITPEEFEDIVSKKKLPSTKKRLVQLYKKYEEFKKELAISDSKDLLLKAINVLQQYPLKHDHPVFIHGIYDITNQQKKLLAGFLGESDAVATVPWWKGVDNYLNRYLGFLHELRFKEVEVDKDALEEKSYCLWNEDVNVEVFSCPNKVMETRSIIRKIFNYCVEQKILLNDVGILVRQPEEYIEIFKDELRSASIPYNSMEEEVLLKTPGGRSFYLLLEFMDSNYSRRSFLTLIDGAILKPGILPFSLHHWVKITNKVYIVEGKDNWLNKLDSLIKRKNEAKDFSNSSNDYEDGTIDIGDEDLSKCKKFLERFFADVEAVLECNKWSNFKNSLEKLWVDYFDKNMRGYGEALNIISSFEEVDKIGVKFSFKLAKELLKEALKSAQIKDVSSVEHGLVLAGLMSARCVPFQVAVLPGLTESSFPRIVRQDALLLDEERKRINEIRKGQKKPLIDEKLRGLDEEKLLFGLAMQAGIKQLFISYPRTEDNGKKEKMPSVFFLKAGEKIKGSLITSEKLNEFKEIKLSQHFPVEPSQALNELEFKIALLTQAGVNFKNLSVEKNFPFELESFPQSLRRGLIAQNKRFEEKKFTPYDGVLTKKGLAILREKLNFNNKVFSASELEKYAKCPFAYFLEKVLRVKEYEEPEKIWEIDTPEKGKLVHKILARFYRWLREKNLLPIEENALERRKKELREIAENEFKIAEEREITGLKLLWEFQKATICNWLDVVIEDNVEKADWVPTYFEAKFGYEKKEGEDFIGKDPVTLNFSNGTVKLRGQIDRIDFSKKSDALKVVDYKTGSSSAYSKDYTNKGKHLQVLLYAYCASNILNKSLASSYGEYFFLKENKHKCQNFYDRWEELDKVLEAIAYGMNNGLFFPYKEYCKSDEHTYCTFKFLCRGADEIYEDKKEDEKVAKWRIIKETKENKSKKGDKDVDSGRRRKKKS